MELYDGAYLLETTAKTLSVHILRTRHGPRLGTDARQTKYGTGQDTDKCALGNKSWHIFLSRKGYVEAGRRGEFSTRTGLPFCFRDPVLSVRNLERWWEGMFWVECLSRAVRHRQCQASILVLGVISSKSKRLFLRYDGTVQKNMFLLEDSSIGGIAQG